MKKTSSVAPLVLSIIGGILGIIAGTCVALCAEAVESVQDAVEVEVVVTTTMKIAGWLVLVGSVVGLVGGCCAKSQNWGTLVLLIGGIVVLVGLVGLSVLSDLLFGLSLPSLLVVD